MKKTFLIVLLNTAVQFCSFTTMQAGPTNLVLRGVWPEYARGDAEEVRLAGNRAHVACGYGGLMIFDVTVPDQPAMPFRVAASRFFLIEIDDEVGTRVVGHNKVQRHAAGAHEPVDPVGHALAGV